MAAFPANAAAAGVAPAGTTGGAQAVRDRTGSRAVVHGVPDSATLLARAIAPGPMREGRGAGGGPHRPACCLGSQRVEPKGP